MYTNQLSYLSPKLEGRENQAKGGVGVFAREAIKAGERLSVWSGVIVPADQLDDVAREARKQIGRLNLDQEIARYGGDTPGGIGISMPIG